MANTTQKEVVSGLATFRFADDTNTGLHSTASDTVSLLAGGTTVASFTSGAQPFTFDATNTAPRVAKVAITGGTTTATATFAISNPSSTGALILDCFVKTDTASTGAATADIGLGAAATTGNDTIMDGLTINGLSANQISSGRNATDAGTNGVLDLDKPIFWSSTQFVTWQNKADSAGYTGTLYVVYVPV